VRGLAKVVSLELGPLGIRSNLIRCPGPLEHPEGKAWRTLLSDLENQRRWPNTAGSQVGSHHRSASGYV
jgi:hypothetical protein